MAVRVGVQGAGLFEVRKALEAQGVRVPSLHALERLTAFQRVGYSSTDTFVMDVPVTWIAADARQLLEATAQHVAKARPHYSMPPPWQGDGPPPLGPVPDFAAIDVARNKELAELPYKDALGLQLVRDTLELALPVIRRIQRRHKVEELHVRPGMVRLLAGEAWRKASESTNRDSGGYWEAQERIAYLSGPDTEVQSDRASMLWTAYGVVHELCHGGQSGNGIARFSMHLNEAVTDRMAMEAFEEALPSILNDTERQAHNVRRSEKSVVLDGVSVSTEYTFAGELGYSRSLEMEILRELERREPLIGSYLLSCAFQGNDQDAEAAVRRCVTREELALLKDPEASPSEILRLLRRQTS